MVKRKKTVTSKNDTKVTAIVIGLFAAAIILFVIFSKAKEEPSSPKASSPSEEVESYIPEGSNKPVESRPAEYAPAESAPVSQPEYTEPSENVSPSGGGRIAIIIDDWGMTTANCKYLKEIPEPLAVSILPGLRHTKDIARCAQENHKLAMLHLPLEAMHNGDIYPPNYIIKTSMPQALVSKIVDEDLDQLPSIEGVNNHMGSKATADRLLMKIILRKLRERGLFFVDSMTSRYSVSASLAEEMGLRYGKRDVFLDNVNTREAITKQLKLLAQKAHRRGYAVAIGHDRHLTMQVIEDEIPLLEKQGFVFVSIKDVLKNR